uniref:Uncharacterized protein n=1 Tax=Oryza nivara TaxID=4536 RepID=A0A0E0GY95_ORYNI
MGKRAGVCRLFIGGGRRFMKVGSPCLNSSALAFDGTLAGPSPAPSAAARGAQPTSPARLPFHLLPWKNLRYLPLAGLRLPLLEKNTNAIYSRGEVEKQKRFLDESRIRDR